MAVRTLSVEAITTEALGDTSDATDDKHLNLRGGSTTQQINIKEVYAAGLEASTSAPQKLSLAHVSQIATGTLAVVAGTGDGPDSPHTVALAAPALFYTSSTTLKARRLVQTTRGRLAQCGFNALGGIVRIRFAHGEEPGLYGNAAGGAAGGGECMLSCFTGTTAGVIAAHIKYEPLVMLFAIGLSLLA